MLKPTALVAMKLAPAYAGAAFSMNDVVAIATAIYTALMGINEGWKLWEKWKASRVKPPGSPRTKQDE